MKKIENRVARMMTAGPFTTTTDRRAVQSSDRYCRYASFARAPDKLLEPFPAGASAFEGEVDALEPVSGPKLTLPPLHVLHWLLRAMPVKDARFYLCGIHVNLDSEQWSVTDGIRIHTTAPLPMDPLSGCAVILPASLASLLPGLLPSSPVLRVDVAAQKWSLDTRQVTMRGNLIDAKYPDLLRVVSRELELEPVASAAVVARRLLVDLPKHPRKDQACFLNPHDFTLQITRPDPMPSGAVCLDQRYIKQAFVTQYKPSTLTVRGPLDPIILETDVGSVVLMPKRM